MKKTINIIFYMLFGVIPFFIISSNGITYHKWQALLVIFLVCFLLINWDTKCLYPLVNKKIKLTHKGALFLSYVIPLICDFLDKPHGINRPLGAILMILSFLLAAIATNKVTDKENPTPLARPLQKKNKK